MEVSKREKEKGIIPDTEVDAYMKVHSSDTLWLLKLIMNLTFKLRWLIRDFLFSYRQFLLKDSKEVCKQITS